MKNIPQATRHVFVGSLACSTSYLWCQSSRKQTLLSSTNGCSFFGTPQKLTRWIQGKPLVLSRLTWLWKARIFFEIPKGRKTTCVEIFVFCFGWNAFQKHMAEGWNRHFVWVSKVGFFGNDFCDCVFLPIFELEKSRIFAEERSSFWRVSNRMILWETYFWRFPHEDFPHASYGGEGFEEWTT